MKVGPDGQLMDSTPKKSSPAIGTPTAPAKKRPYPGLKPRAKRNRAALLAKGLHQDELYHAALKKANMDTRYVMLRMKEDPNLASEIKEWHLQKYKKKKRMYYLYISYTSYFF